MNKNDFKDFQNYLIDKKHFSSNTVNSYERDLRKLFIYLDSNGYDCDDIRSWLTEVCINNYMEYLRDNKYSAATLARTVSTVHVYSEYLFDKNIIKDKPQIDIKITKDAEHDLVIFTRDEIAQILDIDTLTLNDFRDKAIFELSYSIGIKPTECINLEMKDVNLEIGYIKYRKQDGYRTVALNTESIEAIRNYLGALKKHKVPISEESKLFLNHDGEGISRQGYWKIFKKRQKELELTKELNTMNFRNSLAVHLLEDNVPIQDVQEILGLKNIHSLKSYIKSLKKTKAIKRMFSNHPRKAMK